MKKKFKKLNLNTETVMNLTDLKEVAGGVTEVTGMCSTCTRQCTECTQACSICCH